MDQAAYRKLVLTGIVLLGILIYVHTLHFPFVFDSLTYITNNPLIKGFDYYDDLLNITDFAKLDEKLGIVIFHEHSPTWFSNPFTQARRAELVR
jgi:hypothetical protein